MTKRLESNGSRDVNWHEWRARQREILMDFGMPADEAEIEAARAEQRARVRSAWVTAQLAAWRAATKHCDEAWMRLVREHPDEDEELEPPPEQELVDRLHGELRAIADHDRWPRHLYFSGI